jgi:Mycothiol maleylpyruvate isomerase N-terminal domain
MDTWPTIHAERRALAADMRTVTGDQWDTPSLCGNWTVRDEHARREP